MSLDWTAISERALGRLLEHAPDGFAEARHTLRFPRAEGFDVDADEQTGDTFARALIADALLDLRPLRPALVAPLVEREAEHLLAMRDRTGARAWRYFPGLQELPPDADDLAQVMQVLLRAGRRNEVAYACEGPVQLVLAAGFETWIVPPHSADEDLERQRWWIANAWGTGVDTEVVANLLFALALYDRARYAGALAAGARLIAGREQEDGWWRSSWYHGPFYGTWTVVRALAALDPRSAALDRAAAFAAATQRASGGWGPAPDGDALSTALALLTLGAVARARGTLTLPAALPAAHAFLAAREPAADPLVRMELGRPSGRPWAVLSYGSETVTTAFVGRAAAAWAELT